MINNNIHNGSYQNNYNHYNKKNNQLHQQKNQKILNNSLVAISMDTIRDIARTQSFKLFRHDVNTLCVYPKNLWITTKNLLIIQLNLHTHTIYGIVPKNLTSIHNIDIHRLISCWHLLDLSLDIDMDLDHFGIIIVI